ncbi:MAG TPA: hypothetical protein PK671_06980, partial [Candidatus Obscuribacter sp.]|nr:hypothetical protein [Candidatus Obscuribacter sp.]
CLLCPFFKPLFCLLLKLLFDVLLKPLFYLLLKLLLDVLLKPLFYLLLKLLLDLPGLHRCADAYRMALIVLARPGVCLRRPKPVS